MAELPPTSDFVTFETERLVIEPLQISHADRLVEGLSDPELYHYMPLSEPGSLAEVSDRFQRLLAGSGTKEVEWLNWAIRLKGSDVYIGTLQATVYMNSSTANIAYFIFRQYWNNGYGRESCAWLCSYLCDEKQCNKVVAEVDTLNVRSIALLEAIGFKKMTFTMAADHFKGRDSNEWLLELDCSC